MEVTKQNDILKSHVLWSAMSDEYMWVWLNGESNTSHLIKYPKDKTNGHEKILNAF